ncbi:hypothetical protein DENSPDRAFT_909581 [Dentipellis sp. KUC8613]|nr:hypothetical protein DENSPDRAFT_909581 [Dentipellis sp. KUC8613]
MSTTGLPLRSAMKHSASSSRPGTPNLLSPPTSPAMRSSPLLAPQIALGYSPGSSMTPSSSQLTAVPISPSPSSLHLSAYPTSSPTHSTITPPNAAQGYTPKVSFDTFENPAASMFSFTLQTKSDGYARTRHTRVYLCATSSDESGRQALEWAIENLVQDGDELIIFRGIDQEDLEKDHDVVRDDARDLMRRVQERCIDIDPDRKLSIIVEFIAGKVVTTIDRLIALYRPDSIVVGTRGIRGMKHAWGAAFGAPGMGSVSKYCLSHSPVPIIVVRPESKVRKTMEKRKADPKRGQHFGERYRMQALNNIHSVPITSTQTR